MAATSTWIHPTIAEHKTEDGTKQGTEHVEHVAQRRRERLPIRVQEAKIPYISAEEIVRDGSGKNGNLWLVVDDIVYDCSDFVHSHPGGKAFIQGFAGQDCSWQFWNFHSRQILERYALPLRIGKTDGVQNKHQPPDKNPRKREHRGVSQLSIKDW